MGNARHPSRRSLESYLEGLLGRRARLLLVEALGERPEGEKEIKGFGYGVPYLLKVKVGPRSREFVFETVKPGSFGHDFPSDRAQSLLLAHHTYNKLPRHARSVDVGAITHEGELKSLGDAQEFFLLVERARGRGYYLDLQRIKAAKALRPLDRSRCLALSRYLASIHRRKGAEPSLYVRRIRDLVGHGECIMGLLDSYPERLDFTTQRELQRIETTCMKWRWRLKGKTHRLCQVHGDFHPWNILFRKGADFTVLDRSRGEWGEAADDVTALTINYLFFSLQAYGRLDGPFHVLYRGFLETYLAQTGDLEILEVMQPFYAWRALVLASPVWYPNLSREVRRKLFNFIVNLLDTEKVEYKRLNQYLKEP